MKFFGDKSDENNTTLMAQTAISSDASNTKATDSLSTQTAQITDDVIQAILSDMEQENYTAAIHKLEPYRDADEPQANIKELYEQCIQKNTEICERCIQLYEATPSNDILSKLSLLRNAAEHIPDIEHLQTLEALLADIQTIPALSNHTAEQSVSESNSLPSSIIQTIGRLFDKDAAPTNTIVPSNAEVSKLSECMTALISERDYSKKLELSHSITKYFPPYLVEQIRTTLHLFKRASLQKALDETPCDDLVKRISICKSLFELTDDKNYQTQLTTFENELKIKTDAQNALLISNYTNNKSEIYNTIARNLIQRNYISAADDIILYYPIAKEDEAFSNILRIAKQTAILIKSASLQDELKTLKADDYTTQHDIYHKLLKLNPLDANYLTKLDAIEAQLNKCKNARDNEIIESGNDDTPSDCSQDPLVVTHLPATIRISDTSLQRIHDPKTIQRIANFLTSAASICHRGSALSEKIGKFMHKYSNSPFIQLGATLGPAGAAVSPIMESLSIGSATLSKALAQGETYLHDAAELLKESQCINGVFLAIIKPCDQFISACQKLPDVTQALLNDLADMASTLASYVVGNYYMSQINAKLDEIQTAITKVSDFQDSEYQSKVMALCAQISKMSHFREEIIDNDALCRRELTKLADYEHECIELIGQANIALSKASSSPLTNYENYESNLKEMAKWYQYQDSLLRILSEISKFNFTLNCGTVSIENCSTLFNLYEKQVINVRDKIRTYHQTATVQFEVDLVEKKRKVQSERTSGFFSKLTNLVDSNTSQPIADDIVEIIEIQMDQKPRRISYNENLYQKDIRIVFKDNSFYYLTDSNTDTTEAFDIDWALSVLKAGE